MSETVFYQRLQKLCEEKGISITALADAIGKGSATASGWKKGSIPRPDTIRLSVRVNNVHTNNGAIGNFHAPVTISNGSERQLSANEIELLHIFAELKAMDQAKVLVFANELKEKAEK